MADYKKYKDRRPEDTLFRIQSILHEAGITTSYKWIENEYEGCYSNSVSVYPTSLGTNGKGTDRIYALTSGYAELMERIQNQVLYIGAYSPEDEAYGGFYRFPDQKMISYEALIQEKNGFVEHVFQELDCRTYDEKLEILRKFGSIKEGMETECICIPFADVENNRIVYIPEEIALTCGSNGMAAGNTMEEALVQGLAEIFERYVNRKIALEHICPPTVPKSYIEGIPSLAKVIREIEKDGEYEVIVKDCSLGKGFPVAAIIIINKKTGGFGVKFASHPSFAVALERTLTEAFQGKNLEFFTTFNFVGSQAHIEHRDNVTNIIKVGNGTYPKELLIGTPDYEFAPFDLSENRTNAQMLKGMIEIIHKEGYELFVHDSSYLGFPSYFAIVPGMSEMFPIDRLRIRERRTYNRLVDSMGHLPELTDEEAQRIKTYITFKKKSILDDSMLWLSGHPFTKEFPGKDRASLLLKAMCCYQLEDYMGAAESLLEIAKYYNEQKNQEDTAFYGCCSRYAYFRSIGCDGQTCSQLIKTLYAEELANTVIDILSDPKSAMKKVYPKTACYDCERCEIAEKGMCEYQEVSVLIKKIKDIAVKNIPSQELLLQELQVCMRREYD